MPIEQATEALLDIVVEEIARVLRLPPKEVDRHRPLAEIGMDSLMMLELQNDRGGRASDRAADDVAGQRHHTDRCRAPRSRRWSSVKARSEAASGTIVALAASHLAADAEAAERDGPTGRRPRGARESRETCEGPLMTVGNGRIRRAQRDVSTVSDMRSNSRA